MHAKETSPDLSQSSVMSLNWVNLDVTSENRRRPPVGKRTLATLKLARLPGLLSAETAAVIGLQIVYRGREKMLARDDPDAFARLQRLKTAIRQTMDEDGL